MENKRDFDFNVDKNKELLAERGVGFKQIIVELNADKELAIVEHPNITKYSNQKIFIVEIKGYVYAVPFVQKGNYFFLKTVFPSRKLTEKYLKRTK